MQPTGEEVRAQLERLLASKALTGSTRLRRFLSFIVERALQGEGQQLKEYTVGTEVFDRGDDYDPRIDSIVRVEAGRLRARLDEYYRQAGSNDAVIIRMPRGGYTPVFERRLAPSVVDSASNTSAVGSPAEGRRRFRWLALAGTAAATVVVVTLVRSPDIQSNQAEPVRANDVHLGAKAEPTPTSGAVSTKVEPAARRDRTVNTKANPAARRDRDPGAIAEPVPGVRVAVLPLTHYSTDPAVGLLAARLTDGVLTELVRTGRVHVVSRTSTLQFAEGRRSLRDVARALDAHLVVEGSVYVDADRIRVQMRMVDPDVDRKFLLHEFEGTTQNLDELQRRIAAAITTSTRPAIAQIQH